MADNDSRGETTFKTKPFLEINKMAQVTRRDTGGVRRISKRVQEGDTTSVLEDSVRFSGWLAGHQM